MAYIDSFHMEWMIYLTVNETQMAYGFIFLPMGPQLTTLSEDLLSVYSRMPGATRILKEQRIIFD